MSWWKKQSQYRRREWNWWEQEADRYGSDDDSTFERNDDPASPDYTPPQQKRQGSILDTYQPTYPTYNGYGYGAGSYGGGYSSWWRPKYDMSVSLETRVVQLIKTITGRSLKLCQAWGWGNDDKYFYYNPNDLKDATDDEILGRILHQLAKELNAGSTQQITAKNKAQPEYRHLLNTLEDNRADAQLQRRYAGVRYYAQELWEERKFDDNPLNRYQKELKLEEWVEQQWFGNLQTQIRVLSEIKKNTATGKEVLERYAEYNTKVKEQQNPAWEFCFNINAVQNGEEAFDFSAEDTDQRFARAVPYIQQYLAAETIEEALRVYPEIQRHYPVPNQDQQEQMDRQMSATEGMSQDAMAQERAEKDAEEERRLNGTDVDDAEDGLLGRHDTKASERILQRNLSRYAQMRGEVAGVISTLHALISSILKDNSIRRYTRPFKRGKIDSKRMYKLTATDNLRIFKKPRVVSQQRYSMVILVDQSGSMQGMNSYYAVQGAIVLAEVFEQLGLPYEVIGFDGNCHVFKRFDRGLERAYIPSLDTEFAGGGTDDRGALNVVREHLTKFDPGSVHPKGIFVITDGDGQGASTKEVVTEIERNLNATVFGIGIGDMKVSDLQRTYNRYLRVDQVSDLPRELVNLMRGQFARKG